MTTLLNRARLWFRRQLDFYVPKDPFYTARGPAPEAAPARPVVGDYAVRAQVRAAVRVAGRTVDPRPEWRPEPPRREMALVA